MQAGDIDHAASGIARPGAAEVADELRERWKWLVGLGALAVAGGLVAIAVPAAASVATAIFIGWILIFSGAVQLVRACLARDTGRVALHLAAAAVAVCAGAYLILIPLSATITLTVVLVIVFVLTGAARIAVGVRDRQHAPARGMIASGLAAMLIRDSRARSSAEFGRLGDRSSRRRRPGVRGRRVDPGGAGRSASRQMMRR